MDELEYVHQQKSSKHNQQKYLVNVHRPTLYSKPQCSAPYVSYAHLENAKPTQNNFSESYWWRHIGVD